MIELATQILKDTTDRLNDFDLDITSPSLYPNNPIKDMANKKACAAWSTPRLYVDCPHCGEYQDLWTQNANDHGYVFTPLESYDEKECEEVEFECEECHEIFELENISY